MSKAVAVPFHIDWKSSRVMQQLRLEIRSGRVMRAQVARRTTSDITVRMILTTRDRQADTISLTALRLIRMVAITDHNVYCRGMNLEVHWLMLDQVAVN